MYQKLDAKELSKLFTPFGKLYCTLIQDQKHS